MALDDFIGSGWAFPAAISRTGSVRLVSGVDEVDAAIRMILSTVPGERVMRPEFGCAMWEMLFAPLTAGTLGLVEQTVREALARWEPRIAVESVVVAEDPDDPQAAIATITYRLIVTQARERVSVGVTLAS